MDETERGESGWRGKETIMIPVTHEEFFLAYLEGEEVEIPAPVTRKEMYLAHLCGEEIELPIPVTIDEMYLAALCGMINEVPYPVTRMQIIWAQLLKDDESDMIPVTREERYWTNIHLWEFNTVSGNPITFTAERAAPLKQLSVAFSPVQSLNGYDAPWPAGGGKNKFDVSAITWTSGIRNDDGSQGSSTSSHYTNAIPVLPDTTYTLSGKLRTSASNYRIYYLGENEAWISRTSTVGTESYTFTTPATCQFIQIQVANAIDLTENVQLEIGEAATSYAPYSNICPISGTSGNVDVWRGNEPIAITMEYATYDSAASKFMFRDNKFVGADYTIVKNGLLAAPGINFDPSVDNLTYEEASTHTSDPAGKWFVKESTAAQGTVGPVFVRYDWNKTAVAVGDLWYIRPFMFATDPNGETSIYYGQIKVFTGGQSYTNPNVYSSTDPDNTYNRYQVTIPTPPGTVYSGTLDVLTGVLTVGYGAYVLDGVSNKASNLEGPVASDSQFVNVIGKYHARLADLANNLPYGATDYHECSHFVWKAYSERRQVRPDQITWFSSTRTVEWFSNSFTTLDEFNGYLAEQYANGTPVTLVYELATPTTIQLTAQEVSSLLGENVVWSTANGDLTVEYRSN